MFSTFSKNVTHIKYKKHLIMQSVCGRVGRGSSGGGGVSVVVVMVVVKV